MLDILVREPFAPRTLCQSYIAADHGRCGLPFAFTVSRSKVDRLLRRVRLSRLGRAVDGRRPARARIAAMEDMEESGNWVTTFYANGHTTLPEAWYVGMLPDRCLRANEVTNRTNLIGLRPKLIIRPFTRGPIQSLHMGE